MNCEFLPAQDHYRCKRCGRRCKHDRLVIECPQRSMPRRGGCGGSAVRKPAMQVQPEVIEARKVACLSCEHFVGKGSGYCKLHCGETGKVCESKAVADLRAAITNTEPWCEPWRML